MEGLIFGILRYTKSTYYNINSLGYLFVMFTTIIAFDVMRRTQRKLKPCVIPEHENLAERYGIEFCVWVKYRKQNYVIPPETSRSQSPPFAYNRY